MKQFQKSLEQQRRLLLQRFPGAQPWEKVVRGRTYLLFDLQLRPTESSAVYAVRYVYALGERPLVFVVDPEPVDSAHGVRTPHLNGDWTLCLYDANAREWTPADAIVDTIVPWTMRWLFHYEHWLVFGEWLGDPVPHAEPKPSDAAPIKLEDVR